MRTTAGSSTKQIFRVDRTSFDTSPYGGYDIRMGIRHLDGRLDVATPIALLSVKLDEPAPSAPMISGLSPEGAQSLMDELWNAGVRPSDIGTAGHLQATQQHLKDMRALVGHMAGVELPQL